MKILIAHWKVLEPDTNSGDLRLYEIISILKNAGHQIVFMQPGRKFNRYLSDIGLGRPTDINIAFRTPRLFRLFLKLHNFDVAILSPYDTFCSHSHLIRNTIPGCKLILDTIDLFHVRTHRLAELTGDPTDIEFARQTYDAEWKCLKEADSVWVVTEIEENLIASSVKRVNVIRNFHRPATAFLPYGQREGIVFLGGYGHAPNVDAVTYFVKEILPLIHTVLPEVPIIIAGSNPPEEFQRYTSENGLIVTGYIPDHRVILGTCRIGIAPLRYGAGMKGKIGEYLSCGLPCVTTSIGGEGMNFRDGVEVLIADDPVEFANKVITAYTDPSCWQMLSENGIQYIHENLSPLVLKGSVEEAVYQVCIENEQRPSFLIHNIFARLLSAVKLFFTTS